MSYLNDDRVMHRILDTQSARRPDKVFVESHTGSLTYRELAERSNTVARALVRLGVRKGDRVAVMMGNHLDFILSQLAISRTGAIMVPVNRLAMGVILANILRNSAPRVLIYDAECAAALEEANCLSGNMRLVVRGAAPIKGGVAFDDLGEDHADAELPEVGWSDPVDIFYTSGSTGEAKGVVLAHNHHYVFGNSIIAASNYGEDDRMYISLPLYHGMGSYMSIMPMLLCGGSIALAESFSASRWLADVRHFGATTTWAVNSIAPILMKTPAKADDADNSLRTYHFSGMPRGMLESFEKRFGVRAIEHYGSTEVGHLAYSRDGRRKEGFVGQVNHEDYDVRIVDENDVEVPAGEPGECVCRPRQPFTQMLGYHERPADTLAAVRNCWLHTGDLCLIDEDGFLKFVGRTKDMIRRRGENIPCLELENLIQEHPSVAVCAVIPVPAEMGEEEVKAVVELASDATTEAPTLGTYFAQKIPKYMVPRYVEVVEALPRLANEKLDKRSLSLGWATPATYDVVTGKYLER